MDMDMSALPPTRTVSPVPEVPTPPQPAVATPKEVNVQQAEETQNVQPRKTGIGSLMQAAKQEVNVPEFDMGAFGF